MVSLYDVDPDGDLRVIISEPKGPFAPAAGVEEPQFDASGHDEPPAPDDDNGAENAEPPAPDSDIGAENDEQPAPDNGYGAENHVSEREDAEVDAQANGSPDTPPTVYSLRLSLKHLTLASPCVRKRYSGAWKDSTEKDGDGLLLWRIDDVLDPNAFIIVMNVIHWRNGKVPRFIGLELLAKIAVVTDYLQCHESMEILSVEWTYGLKSRRPETFGREVILWIMISSVFRTQESFGYATRVAILRSEGELPSAGLPIHQNTLDKIEVRRHDLIIQLIGFLYDTIARLRAGLCSPACDAVLLGSLITQVKAVDLFQSREEFQANGISVETVLQEISGLSTPEWYHPSDVEPLAFSKRKTIKRNRAAPSSPPSVAHPADLPLVWEHERERCTLGTLFMYVKDLEAGVTGLELEDVFGS